jgi:L-2-hydroxyglutarate oxidase
MAPPRSAAPSILDPNVIDTFDPPVTKGLHLGSSGKRSDCPAVRDADVAVIGGGIVGLATADALLRAEPSLDLLLYEKEQRLASHQTGRNSGVLHSGIYYRPGSLKARTTEAGRRAMLELCADEGVAHDVCGKLVVATEPEELPRLRALEERAAAQGIVTERLGPDGIRDHEPHAAGLAALRVPSAGLVDFAAVSLVLARRIEAAGGRIVTGTHVDDVRSVPARRVVACAGLHSDRLAGDASTVQVLPFRGEYHELVPARRSLVRDLIYPVPDPAFPFLGVHLTRSLDGSVRAGPNAVLALSREGYRWRDVSPRDVAGMLRYPGLWRLGRRHWRTGVDEVVRSLRPARLARDLARLVPELTVDDLEPAPSGVRAQAVDRRGELLDDFVVEEVDGVAHVVNAPSPAATASLEIGRLVAERALGRS